MALEMFPAGMRLRVLYDFAAVEEGELSVRAGEGVCVCSPAHADAPDSAADGWVLVEVPGTMRSGFVPADYVAPAVQETTPAHARPTDSFTYASPSVAQPRPAGERARGGGDSEHARGGDSEHARGGDSEHAARAYAHADAPSGYTYMHDPRGASGVAAAAVLDAVASAVSPVAGPAPPLATPADYAALFASHEEWFKAASAKRADTYRSLQAEAMDIVRAVSEAESRSNALLSRISELDALIGEERNRWAAKVADDTAPMVGAR